MTPKKLCIRVTSYFVVKPNDDDTKRQSFLNPRQRESLKLRLVSIYENNLISHFVLKVNNLSYAIIDGTKLVWFAVIVVFSCWMSNLCKRTFNLTNLFSNSTLWLWFDTGFEFLSFIKHILVSINIRAVAILCS